MDEKNLPRRANLFRISIRTVLLVTLVVAAYFAGRRASKDEIAKLKHEVAQNRALADHAFNRLYVPKFELQNPTFRTIG